jgi:ribosomal protein L13
MQIVGRAAAVIAHVLQGKDRPDYRPQHDGGDVVVVINASKAIFTGKKMKEKIYYSHSGKPGNLKTTTPQKLKDKFGGAAMIWKAVDGMLPKNKLRAVCLFCCPPGTYLAHLSNAFFRSHCTILPALALVWILFRTGWCY